MMVVGGFSWVGGLQTFEWVTLLWMVLDHPWDHWEPLFVKWVIIFWKVGDRILDGG